MKFILILCLFYLMEPYQQDQSRRQKILNKIVACINEFQETCPDIDDLVTILIYTYEIDDRVIENSEEFTNIMRDLRPNVGDNGAKSIYSQTFKTFHSQNRLVHFQNLKAHMEKHSEGSDPLFILYLNKFLISHGIEVSEFKTIAFLHSKIDHPLIYRDKLVLEKIFEKYRYVHQIRTFSIINLISQLSTGDEKLIQLSAIKLLEYLQLFISEKTIEFQDFVNVMSSRVSIDSNKATKIHVTVNKFFQLQNKIKSDFLSYINSNAHINVFHASDYIERFIGVYGYENKEFTSEDIKAIFYGKLTGNIEGKVLKVVSILASYPLFKERQKIKESVLEIIEALNPNTELEYNMHMTSLIEAYDINLMINEYNDLKNNFILKDSVVNDREIYTLFSHISKYLKKYRTRILLNRINKFIKINPSFNVFQLYEYIYMVIEFYELERDDKMTIKKFVDSLLKKDDVVDDVLTRFLHRYVVQYIRYKKRYELKHEIIDNFEKNSLSSCLLFSNDLKSLIEAYEIDEKEVKNYYELKNKIQKYDGITYFYELQLLHKIFNQCYDFTIRKKLRDDLHHYIRNKESTNINGHFILCQNIIKSYKLQDEDIQSIEKFKNKFELLDHYATLEEIIGFYPLVKQFHKYTNRKNHVTKLFYSLKKSSLTFFQMTEVMQNIKFWFKIKTESVRDVKNWKNVCLGFDKKTVPSDIANIYPNLINYYHYLDRQNILKEAIYLIENNVEINNEKIQRYMKLLFKEYSILKKNPKNIGDIIAILTEMDESIAFKNIFSLLKTILNYMELYSRNTELTETSEFIFKNEDAVLIQKFLSLNRLFYVFKFKRQEIENIKDFRNYLAHRQGLFSETEINIIYSHLIKFMEYQNRDILQSDMSSYLIKTTQVGFFKLAEYVSKFIKLYQIKSRHVTNFHEFLQHIHHFDSFINHKAMQNIYLEVIKLKKYFKNIENQMKIFELTDNENRLKLLEKETRLNIFVSTYSLFNEKFDIFKDFEGLIVKSDIYSIEIYLKKIQSHVLKYNIRIKSYEI